MKNDVGNKTTSTLKQFFFMYCLQRDVHLNAICVLPLDEVRFHLECELDRLSEDVLEGRAESAARRHRRAHTRAVRTHTRCGEPRHATRTHALRHVSTHSKKSHEHISPPHSHTESSRHTRVSRCHIFTKTARSHTHASHDSEIQGKYSACSCSSHNTDHIIRRIYFKDNMPACRENRQFSLNATQYLVVETMKKRREKATWMKVKTDESTAKQ